MLLGFSGLIAGYDGSFEFKAGADYPTGFNYTVMRVFCAFFGALMVPMAYFTGLELNMRKSSAIFFALMVTFELSFLNISRFILLDSLLLFFTTLCTYSLIELRNQEKRGYTYLLIKELLLLIGIYLFFLLGYVLVVLPV